MLLHLPNILSATPATCWCLRRASTSRAGWLPEHECQNNTVDARYIATTMLHFNSLEPLLLDLTTMLLLQRSMQNYQLSCPRWILCCGWRAQWWYLRFRCPSHSSGCGHSPSHSVRCHFPWTGEESGMEPKIWSGCDLWFVDIFEDMDTDLSEVMWPLLLSERSEGGAVDSPSGGETVLHCTTIICTSCNL